MPRKVYLIYINIMLSKQTRLLVIIENDNASVINL